MKRRHFLQFTGGFLGALGLSQLELRNKSLQYGKVLAQNTSRKLALLVGINGYPNGADLNGCVNDVYLQRELLIHRFGFNPNDILLVTDEERERPTRNNILTAFDEHLIKQAKADDVVVFHYSGHGYQVIDETQSDQLNSTFVPIDHQFKPRNNRQDELEVNHIMGHTLYLLMSAIKTENFTAVLDCCHSGGGTRGSTKIRAFQIPKELTRNLNTDPKIYPNQEELNYQENLLSQLGLNRENATNLWNQKIAKGMVLAAAQEVELAADGTSVGYDAGAFTYALTQYLWQFSGDNPVKEVMRGVSLGTTRLSPNGQHPLYEVHPEDNNQKPIYFLNPTTPNGEGVIKKVNNNNEVELWLGGFNPQILTGASKDSVFRVVDHNGEEKGDIIVQERNGLKATALPYADPNSEVPKPLENPAEGDFIKEKAIAIPEDFALLIALDQSLQQYQQELVNDDGFIDDKIKIVPLYSEQNSTEKPDYILGEMTTEARQLQIEQEVLANLPEIGSRGIFDSALNVIPQSFEVGEDIKAFKQRLIPKLRSFLGLKLIRTLFGGQGASTNSNRLQVSAELKIITSDNQEYNLSSERGISPNFNPQQMEGAIPLLKVGTKTQLSITNHEDKSLYIAVLVFDQIGDLGTVFPDYINGAQDEALFGAGETFVINDEFKKVSQSSNYIPVAEPLGTTELLILASHEPIQKPLKTLAELMNKTRSRGALDVIGDVLFDTRGWGNPRDLSLPVNVVGSTSLTFKAIAQ